MAPAPPWSLDAAAAPRFACCPRYRGLTLPAMSGTPMLVLS